MTRKWTVRQSRPSRKATLRQRWLRAFRPVVESLETRLTPSNVDVTMFHYTPDIQGWDNQESALSPSTVNQTAFGKLANAAVDGYVYAQPLYRANLMIGGTPHNVAFVATEHDSLYAFDVAPDATTPTGLKLTTLWQRSFINPAAGITSVPNGDVGTGDIVPEVGITGAPAIDPATNVLYLVAKTKEVRSGVNHYVQKLYAIDITSPTGADKYAPYTIGDSTGDGYNNQNTVIQVAGSGADSGGGMVRFSAFRNNQRPSLLILGGRVYVGWSSHGDNGPYHGWVVGFNETTLQPEKWFNITPNARGGGIWQSEGAISTDGTYLYFAEGNGFNGPDPAFDPAHGNYSESVIKLDPTAAGTNMPVADYFTPFNWQQLDNQDADLGSGGVMLLPDAVGSTAHPHLMVETGKDGHIYLIDRDNMGKFNATTNMIVQDVVAGPGGVWGNPAFYQESASSGLLIYHGSGSDTREFRITNGQIQLISSGNYIAYRSNQSFGFPGAQPVITSNGADNTTAVDWELQSDNYGQQGPEVLHAYAARPAAQTGTMPELYNSNQAGQRDRLGGSVKFTSAIVTNGWVFVGQEYNFSVFGLFPTHTDAPGAPTNLTGMGISPTSIQLNWTDPTPNTATGIKILRSTNGTTFTQIDTVPAAATSYTDTTAMQGTVYYYRVVATNQVGDSAASNTVQATPTITPPVLSLDNACSTKVALVWTMAPAANNHYDVERATSPDFMNATTIASNLSGGTLSYTDTPVPPGTYYYRVKAYTASGMSVYTNTVAVRVGPGSAIIDYFNGFPSPPAPPPIDVQANGSAQFAETTARLTNAANQVGSAFSINAENVLNWTSQFKVRLHEGTQPSYANGFTFTIQAIAPGALGQGGAGLGYQGIANSVTIKFETTTGAAENGTGGSTGLFYAGDQPTVPNPAHPGEVNLMLDANMVNLMSQSTKTITLTYAYNPSNPGASVLHEEIIDADHPDTPLEHAYAVDIPSLLGVAASGNTIGYVGFTASTSTNWELQDILGWRFTPNGPAAPHNLMVTSGSNFNDLSWKCTSADEEGFYVERSTSPTGGFMRIATLPAGTTTYHDVVTGNPQGYYYRVQAFNHDAMMQEQDSGYSNIGNGAVITINFPNFTTHGNLSANNNNTGVNIFPGSPPVMRLTDGRGGEASSSFYTTPVGTGTFTTTFTLRDQPVNGAADNVDFVIQNDPRGPAALGGSGGSGGYGGITNSIAIKFDLYSHGSHNPTTGLFTNGQSPDSDTTKDVALTGINLGSGHALQITISYDGASTIQEHVVDTVTNATFDHTYNLGMTLAQIIGGTSAYVGFTGGTGGETATQDILMWTGTFSLAPPQAAGLRVVAMPTTVTAGQPVSITVTAVDQNGNVFPGYTGTVHFTSNDPQAVLPANYTFTAADMGVHTFMVTLKTAGMRTVTATDTSRPALTGSATVTVNPGPVAAFVVAGFPSPVPPGTSAPFTVTAKDAFGNTVTNYTGTVHFSSSDNAAQLPANYTFTAADMGVHTFTATLNTPGNQTITVTDTASGATGTEMVTVNPTNLTFDYSGGFANHTGLTANGSAAFIPAGSNPVGTFAGHQDIGTPGDPSPAGNTTFSNGVYTLTASGSDIWDTTDHFQYAYEALTGDGQIIARLVSANTPDFWTKAGLMIRANLTPGSPNAFMLDTPDPAHQEPVQQWRDTQDQGSGDTGNHGTGTTPNVPTPMWLRLVRQGNTFIGYWAMDNNGMPGTWQLLMGNETGHMTTMPATVYVGLALTAHNNGQTATAVFDHVTVTGNTNGVARLTDGGTNEAGSIFTNSRLVVGSFTTTFTFHQLPGSNPIADGMAFVLQADPRGIHALDPAGGGGLGYGPDTPGMTDPNAIVNSIAIKFDVYNNAGEGINSTGLFVNGHSPTISQGPPDVSIDLTGTGIDLHSGHNFQVTLAYNGTTLTETITDTVTNATFSHDYLINIPQIIGSPTAYAGFTGGTGGLTAVQDVLAWTGVFPNPQQVAYLRISAPANATAGTPFAVTVTALDTNNHQIAYTGTVHFTSTDPQAQLPADYTFTAADNGQHTFMVTLKTAGPQALSVTDRANGSLTATAIVTVSPGPVSAFMVMGYPASTTAGTPQAFIVTAKDAFGNTVTGYTGTVHFSSSDPQAGLPADYTFTAADMGVHAFVATLYTAGTQSITVTDTTSGATGSQTGIMVSPAAASTLVISGVPPTVTSGVPFGFTVTVEDPYGNPITGYAGTVTFSSSDPEAQLPGDYTFTAADMGTHTFTATLFTPGDQTLTVSDTANPNLTGTQAVAVAPAALIVTGFPSPTRAGDVGIFTVTVVDANGNVIPNYTGTVHFTSSDPQAVLPDDYTFIADDMGTHSFAAILATAGTQSITATDVASGVSGTQDGIEVDPGDLAAFVVQGFPSPVQAGTPGTFTVAAYDAYGNLITGYAGTVSFYSTDPQASLPPDYTFTPDDMGMHTFTATLFTAGPQSIVAYDTTTGAAGSQDGIEVTPSTAVGFIIDIPSPVAAGDFVFFTVTAVDAYGNPNALYTGTVTFSSSDPDANLPDDYTFTPNDNGSHTFAVVFNTPGMQTLTVMDTDDPTISGTQGVEVDLAGAPSAGGHKGTAYPTYLAVGGTEITPPATPPVQYAEAGVPAAPERDHPSSRPAPESAAAASVATPPDHQALDRLFSDFGSGLLSERGPDDLLQLGAVAGRG